MTKGWFSEFDSWEEGGVFKQGSKTFFRKKKPANHFFEEEHVLLFRLPR
jgi:hypothetical protein